MGNLTGKHCKGCSTFRTISDWPKSRAQKDGLGTQCKFCMAKLLCKRCNWILGHADDNIDIMYGLIEYLGRGMT